MRNRNLLIGLTSLLLLGSCTSTKVSSNTNQLEEHAKKNIKITHVTVQEMVAGSQGAANTFQFLMNIELGNSNAAVDSVFYDNMKAKVFLKDAKKSLYVANATAIKKSNASNEKDRKSVSVSFIQEAKRVIMKVDSFQLLEKMYLP